MLTKFFIEASCKVLTNDSYFCYQIGFGSSSLNKGEDEIIRSFQAKHQLDTFLKSKGIDPQRFYDEMERHMRSSSFVTEFKTPYCKEKPCWLQGN
jgi:hypothetical protein